LLFLNCSQIALLVKKLSIVLLLIVLVADSCKEEHLFGSVSVRLSVPAGQSATVGLFDSSSSLNDNDALYSVAVINDHAQFDQVNPGNYRVAKLSSGGVPYKAVQVRAGKTVSVTLN
jgi:hypothetical protein